MFRYACFIIALATLLGLRTTLANPKQGAKLYKTYCASCHGPKGAGLVGSNLTDAEVIHGETKEAIVRVIANGVPSKGMPPWDGILNDQQISHVADFVKSIMGTNLSSPFKENDSIVTPFPFGDANKPLLIRTYMPSMGVPDAVFKNHHRGFESPVYSWKNGTHSPKKKYRLLQGVPAAITVNFGEELSYCFDSTECRLLYTWHGGFLDFTKYWGKGTGNNRAYFAYLPIVMGEIDYRAEGPPLIEGSPQFKGYRKEQDVPVFHYTIDGVEVERKIQPGDSAGVARCHYRMTNISNGLKLNYPESDRVLITSNKGQLSDGKLLLTSEEASDFTLTLTPADK